MLSHVCLADVTAPTRVRPRPGAWLFCGDATVPGGRLQVSATSEQVTAGFAAAGLVAARPQAGTGAVLFGTGIQAAGQAESARQQRTSKKYAHTTLTGIAMNGGGALGSHPARDPV
jgi:hypothetical protein